MKAGFTGFKKKKRPRKKSQHYKATDNGERMKNRLLDCSWGAEANDREWSGPPTPVRLVPFMKWLRPRGFLFLFDRSRLPCTWVCCSESHARRKQQETTTTLSVKTKSDRGSRRIQRVRLKKWAARSLWCGLLPMYLALSSRRSFASFCRCSELIESVGKRTELLFGLLSWTCSSRCISSSFRHQEVSEHGFMSFF